MKRIIARLGANGDGLEKDSPNSAVYSAYIGRQLAIGSHSVVIDDIIAEGGYGVVFKVRNFTHNYFALKRLCVNNDEDLSRTKQEMALLKQFQHKNIIGLIDAGISRNQSGVYEVFMLLQYCRGTVKELVNKTIANRMDINEGTVMSIFCDMCEAVGCLHEKNVIHRDLKIENILIDDSGNYVLCDFGSATAESLLPRTHGIAKTEEEIAKYTTIAYRAPEMVDLYKNLEINTKADIWALGCLLYTLCFLKLPFKDSTLAIQSGEYAVPDDSVYSQNLQKLIGFALHVDPIQRPDIYQVSVLAFRLHHKSRSPLRNRNSLPVPKFEELSLPKTESELKAKPPSSHSTGPALNVAEPVKTSVAPRQRPRGAGPSPLSVSSLPSSVHTTPVSSPPTPVSLPPPPGGDVGRARAALKEPSTSVSTENSSSAPSIQTSPLLIDVGGGDAVASPLCSLRPEAPAPNGNVEQPKSVEPSQDLLSFESPVAPLPPSSSAFPAHPFLSFSAPRPALGLPSRPPGHRRLLSDTSAVPGIARSAGQFRPPCVRLTSPAPAQWGQPRLCAGPTLHQPLKASISMDYIGGNGLAAPPGHSNSHRVPSKPLQAYRTSGIPLNASLSAGDEQPYVNPHHQWQQPLRGNRQLSSSSADLINLSGSGFYQSVGGSPRQSGLTPAAAAASVASADGLRAASALELDAFGSVPFASTPIPPRPQPIQGHTRSASHGQYFRHP